MCFQLSHEHFNSREGYDQLLHLTHPYPSCQRQLKCAVLEGWEAILSSSEPGIPAYGQMTSATWIICYQKDLCASYTTVVTNLPESAVEHRELFKICSNVSIKFKIKIITIRKQTNIIIKGEKKPVASYSPLHPKEITLFLLINNRGVQRVIPIQCLWVFWCLLMLHLFCQCVS